MELKKFLVNLDCLICLRWLVIIEFISLFISTSLTSFTEILLYVAILSCLRKIRGRFAAALGQPIVIMALVFAGFLCLGVFYGVADVAERFRVLIGWRKLLLLPLAVLLFDDVRWKLQLVWVLIWVATGVAFFSYVGLLGFGSKIVAHNHATQGIFLAVAAFAAIVMMFSPSFAIEKGGVTQWGLGLGALFLVVNIIFVTPGRSGYLALLMMSGFACFSFVSGRWLRVGLAFLALSLIMTALYFSPVATKRILIAFHDARNYEQAHEISDMGIRMVLWKNTIQLIKERPFLGYGLGGLKEAYRKQVEGVKGWQGTVADDPHNQYLKIIAEQGLLGLLVFLGFLWSFWRQDVVQGYRLLGLGVLLAWCATSFFSGHFNTSSEGRFIMLWAGAQLAMEKLPGGTESG